MVTKKFSSSSSRASAPPSSMEIESAQGTRSRSSRTTTKYYESTTGLSDGGNAPTLGRVRVTQSTDRNASFDRYSQEKEHPMMNQHPEIHQSYQSNSTSILSRRFSTPSLAGSSIIEQSRQGPQTFETTSPFCPQLSSFRRLSSCKTDIVQNREASQGDWHDLDWEADQYLASKSSPSSGLPSRGTHARTNYSIGASRDIPDFKAKKPYISPYRRMQSPPKTLQEGSPTLAFSGSILSQIAGYSSAQQHASSSRASRAASMSRIDSREVLHQNRTLENDEGRPRRSVTRTTSASRASVGRGFDEDKPIEMFDTQTRGDDETYHLRRQLRVVKNRARAASMSRLQDIDTNLGFGGDDKMQDTYFRQTDSFRPFIHVVRPLEQTHRASSLSRTSHSSESFHTRSSQLPASRASRAPTDSGFVSGRIRETTLYGSLPASGEEMDIMQYVLDPGETFLPTDVSVNVLPTGKKAVTYTRFRQEGSGDQNQANALIDRIIQKTQQLQDSLHTLEDFVKRNRALFPEDIIIYQQMVFYLLDENELKKMGYTPDTEVYGVKIREKLVAPYGSDVAKILQRYYKRYSEVDVEYETRETIRRKRDAVDAEAENEEEIKRKKRSQRIDTEVVEEEEEWLRRRREAEEAHSRRVVDEEQTVKRQSSSQRRRMPSEGPEPPQFTSKPRTRTVGVGETVKFSCSVIGEPEPSLTWYHGNKLIVNDGRRQIDDRFLGSSTLIIRGAQKPDAGSYTARALNPHGEISYTTQLAVEEDELTRRKEALRRPWFIHEVHNTTTQVGQMIVLEAQATGKPVPTFRWQRNNLDIPSEGEHIRIASDSAGGTKLIIRDVKTGDAGLYVCIAENDVGSTSCSATLRVGESFDLTEYYTLPQFGDLPPADIPDQSSKTSRLPFELDDIIMKNWKSPNSFYLDQVGEAPSQGQKPRFVQMPSTNITVTEGDPLTMRCVVEGEPIPLVKWYKGVRELTYTGRHRVLAERNGQHMMQIRQTMLTDPGEYTLVALNACGMVKYTTNVDVLPRVPEKPEVWVKPEVALKEYELMKKTAQGKMAPVFIKRLPREKELIVGGDLEFACQVDEAKMKEYTIGYDIVVKDKKQPAVKVESTNHVTKPTAIISSTSHQYPEIYSSTLTSNNATASSGLNFSNSSSVDSSKQEDLTSRPLATQTKQCDSPDTEVQRNSETSGEFQAKAPAVPAVSLADVLVNNEIGYGDDVEAKEEKDLVTISNQHSLISSSETAGQDTSCTDMNSSSTLQAESAQTPATPTAELLSEISTNEKSKKKRSKSKKDSEQLLAESSDKSEEAKDLNTDETFTPNVSVDSNATNQLIEGKVVISKSTTSLPADSVALDYTSQVVNASSISTEQTSSTVLGISVEASAEAGSPEELSQFVEQSASAAVVLDPTTSDQQRSEEVETTTVLAGNGPQLVSLLESCAVAIGGTATFSCCIAGDDPLFAGWLKDGVLLQEDENIKIANVMDKNDGTMSCRLEILNVRREDGAAYSLRAANSFGEASCTATLSVIDRVIPQISVTYEEDEDEEEEEEEEEEAEAESETNRESE